MLWREDEELGGSWSAWARSENNAKLTAKLRKLGYLVRLCRVTAGRNSDVRAAYPAAAACAADADAAAVRCRYQPLIHPHSGPTPVGNSRHLPTNICPWSCSARLHDPAKTGPPWLHDPANLRSRPLVGWLHHPANRLTARSCRNQPLSGCMIPQIGRGVSIERN